MGYGRPAFVNGNLEIGAYVAQHKGKVGRGERVAVPVQTGKGQQVGDQCLHTGNGGDGVRDDFVGAGIELALIPTLENLHRTGHGAERLLQIVRGDKGELLQLGIGAAQFGL